MRLKVILTIVGILSLANIVLYQIISGSIVIQPVSYTEGEIIDDFDGKLHSVLPSTSGGIAVYFVAVNQSTDSWVILYDKQYTIRESVGLDQDIVPIYIDANNLLVYDRDWNYTFGSKELMIDDNLRIIDLSDFDSNTIPFQINLTIPYLRDTLRMDLDFYPQFLVQSDDIVLVPFKITIIMELGGLREYFGLFGINISDTKIHTEFWDIAYNDIQFLDNSRLNEQFQIAIRSIPRTTDPIYEFHNYTYSSHRGIQNSWRQNLTCMSDCILALVHSKPKVISWNQYQSGIRYQLSNSNQEFIINEQLRGNKIIVDVLQQRYLLSHASNATSGADDYFYIVDLLSQENYDSIVANPRNYEVPVVSFIRGNNNEIYYTIEESSGNTRFLLGIVHFRTVYLMNRIKHAGWRIPAGLNMIGIFVIAILVVAGDKPNKEELKPTLFPKP